MSALNINDTLTLDKNYIIKSVLSKSEKGNVYKVQDQKGTFYVIKEFQDTLTDTERCKKTNRLRFYKDADINNSNARTLAIKEIEFHRESMHQSDNNSPFLFNVDEFFLSNQKCDYLPYIRIYTECGITLFDYLKCHNRCEVTETIKILKAISEALQGLHDKNIVHLDIKPQNLYVLMQGESCWIRILDMGSAQRIGSVDLNTLDLSSGTKRYQSPLMFRLSNESSEIGKEDLIDEISVFEDIYSLCNILLECLINVTYTEVNNRAPRNNVELPQDFLKNDLDKYGFEMLEPCYNFIERIFRKLENEEYNCIKSNDPENTKSFYNDLVILEQILKHEGYYIDNIQYYSKKYTKKYLRLRKVQISKDMLPKIEPYSA